MFPRHSLFLTFLLAALVSSTSAVKAETTNVTTELWRVSLLGGQTESSPALAPDGTLYIGTFQGWLLAISSEGKIKWKFKTGLEIKSSPAIAADGTVYFGSRDRCFYAVTPSGKLKWKQSTDGWVDSSPAIATDGTVYFASWDRNFYAFTPNGSLKWKFATSNLVTTSPAIAADGTVYFGSHDKCLYALSASGNLKWKFLTGAEIDGSPALATDGTIYFQSTDGLFYALNSAGAELWRQRLGGYTASSPVLDADGNIYVMAGNDQVSLHRDGSIRWRHPTQVPLDMAGGVTANGQVIVSMPWHAVSSMDATNCWPPLWDFRMNQNLTAAPNISLTGIIYAVNGFNLYALKPSNAAPPARSSWPLWRADAQHTGRVQKAN
jgi:outer membrane protein assembly factor BamB